MMQSQAVRYCSRSIPLTLHFQLRLMSVTLLAMTHSDVGCQSLKPSVFRAQFGYHSPANPRLERNAMLLCLTSNIEYCATTDTLLRSRNEYGVSLESSYTLSRSGWSEPRLIEISSLRSRSSK